MKRIPVILLAICLLAGAGWWYWTTTPQYAVQQAANAIKAHDVQTFHNWVDVEEVSSSAIDDLLAEPARAVGGAGIVERIVGISIMSIFKPNVVQSMDKQIDNWVAHHASAASSSSSSQNSTGTDAASNSAGTAAAPDAGQGDEEEMDRPKSLMGEIVALVKPPSLKQLFRDYGFTKKNYRGLGQADSADNVAHVGLRFFNPKLNREVQVMLQLDRANGHWQISRVSNMQEVLRAAGGA